MTDLLPPFLVLFVLGLSALSLVAISSLSSTLSVFCLFSGWHSPLDCHLQQLRVCKYLQVFLCFFQTHISFHKKIFGPPQIAQIQFCIQNCKLISVSEEKSDLKIRYLVAKILSKNQSLLINTRLKQSNNNNHNYNLIGFGTVEIKLVQNFCEDIIFIRFKIKVP